MKAKAIILGIMAILFSAAWISGCAAAPQATSTAVTSPRAANTGDPIHIAVSDTAELKGQEYGELSPLPESAPLSSWTPLADLSADYGTFANRERAIANGVYVNVQGIDIYNQSMVDAFYRDVSSGVRAAFMRTIEYTVEGDPIISDYQYDGEIFTVTTDTTRDKFGADKITAATYKYLVLWARPKLSGELDTYYLSNEQDIISTKNDGAILIDGLGIIPSPSEGVNYN